MRYIRELEGLRGIMALWVVFGHSLASLPAFSTRIPPTALNSYAVDVFIILSGFVIFFMLDNKKQVYSDYITQRFFRIFPIYIFAFFLSLLILNFTQETLLSADLSPGTYKRLLLIESFYERPLAHILAHITLLQGVIPNGMLKDASYTVLGQAWSVSVEWQFYLVAPFIFFMLSNLGSRRNIYFTLFLSLAIIMVCKFFSSGFFGNSLGDFAIGFVSYFFYKHFHDKLNDLLISVCGLSLTLIFIFVMKIDAIPYVIWTVTFFSIIKFYKSQRKNLLIYVLDNKIVLLLGRISYSIYMIHMIVLIVFIRLSVMLQLSLFESYLFVILGAMLFSFLLSLITYKFIETPFIKLDKKISSKADFKEA
ncbi:acyltransferase family protein [Klebsiella pneumoniae]|uniref:acyltransferase family protein n=1 Tax=Klebsiella pneumoniae TaxID=573 RepID=UPI0024073215|nr:acyltransferase [Klebsiella pneumoniae]MDF9965069.1 acyltransferase [Klebsiella pneumoniae]HEN5160598.1 acyltransferase [Klebsiella pneumoniae]